MVVSWGLVWFVFFPFSWLCFSPIWPHWEVSQSAEWGEFGLNLRFQRIPWKEVVHVQGWHRKMMIYRNNTWDFPVGTEWFTSVPQLGKGFVRVKLKNWKVTKKFHFLFCCVWCCDRKLSGSRCITLVPSKYFANWTNSDLKIFKRNLCCMRWSCSCNNFICWGFFGFTWRQIGSEKSNQSGTWVILLYKSKVQNCWNSSTFFSPH